MLLCKRATLSIPVDKIRVLCSCRLQTHLHVNMNYSGGGFLPTHTKKPEKIYQNLCKCGRHYYLVELTIRFDAMGL